MAGVAELKSTKEFEQFVANSPSAVVHFYTEWCKPCKQVDQVLQALGAKLPAVHYAKIEAEENSEVSERFDVLSVPYVLLFQDGKVVSRVDGANVPELTSKVNGLVSAQPGATSAEAQAKLEAQKKEALNQRLANLIASAPIMLFMKGTPDAPQCGFSRKMIALLKEVNAVFSSFDILQDNEVRQGLKEYSNWPTFPQLYINKELVGGLDIVREMKDDGELQELVDEHKPVDTGKVEGEPIEARLDRLINSSKIMLFMKGSPSAPRCGFSSQMVELLNSVLPDSGKPGKPKFGHFDILSDPEVRAGLKTYSNWPTYPQLYVNGDLVGGLDVVKQMKEDDEFEEILNGDA